MATDILLDPTSELAPSQRQPLPRLSSLRGTKIALLDISKARGDVFLDRLEERLQDTGAQIERFNKPTFTRIAPVELQQQISTKAEVVIEALAD